MTVEEHRKLEHLIRWITETNDKINLIVDKEEEKELINQISDNDVREFYLSAISLRNKINELEENATKKIKENKFYECSDYGYHNSYWTIYNTLGDFNFKYSCQLSPSADYLKEEEMELKLKKLISEHVAKYNGKEDIIQMIRKHRDYNYVGSTFPRFDISSFFEKECWNRMEPKEGKSFAEKEADSMFKEDIINDMDSDNYDEFTGEII
jgi:hypothetical protein